MYSLATHWHHKIVLNSDTACALRTYNHIGERTPRSMSLTIFLRDKKQARILIDQTITRPTLDQAPPRPPEPQTSNYALIGTVFDYVLRFWLERGYPDAESKPWVAHKRYGFCPVFVTWK